MDLLNLDAHPVNLHPLIGADEGVLCAYNDASLQKITAVTRIFTSEVVTSICLVPTRLQGSGWRQRQMSHRTVSEGFPAALGTTRLRRDPV